MYNPAHTLTRMHTSRRQGVLVDTLRVNNKELFRNFTEKLEILSA